MKQPLPAAELAALREQVRKNGPVPVAARATCGRSTVYRAIAGRPLADVTRRALAQAIAA